MKQTAIFNALMVAAAWLPSTNALAEKSTPPPETRASTSSVQSLSKPVFVQNIATEAVEAVKVVDAFSMALKEAKFDAVLKLLDPKVLVLESGGSERSRDEYMSSHAIADSLFLKKATSQLRYRQAHAEGNVAWVATESGLQTEENGKPVWLLSTETMLLKKTSAGWKIVHIHWSSRTKKPGTSH